MPSRPPSGGSAAAREPEPDMGDDDSYRVNMFADGSGSITYPSGRIACTVAKWTGGQQVVIMDDKPKSTILASFDYDGVGAANFKSGQPRLCVSKQGWSEQDENGNFIEKGEWPRRSKRAVQYTLNKCFVFNFQDRQHITITYQADGETLEFNCGEHTLRPASDNYMNTAVGREGGKAILNVESKRHEYGTLERHAHTKLDLRKYSPIGPHGSQTVMGGTFSLRQKLPGLEDITMQNIIDEQNIMQSRIKMLGTIVVPEYGSLGSTLSKKGSVSAANMASMRLFNSQPLSAATYDELPAIKHTKAQRKVLASLYKHEQPVHIKNGFLVAKSNYKSKRRKLPVVRVQNVDAVIRDVEKGVLLVLACMAEWNPLCRKVGPQLELIHQQLHLQSQAMREPPEVISADDPSNTPQGPQADPSVPQLPGQVLMKYVDMAESTMLQNRYNFRCCPMFLCFYNNQLVHASNTMRYTDEFYEQAARALENGKRGKFLGDNFKFHGVCNTEQAILDRAI